jgi:hypothetical protein
MSVVMSITFIIMIMAFIVFEAFIARIRLRARAHGRRRRGKRAVAAFRLNWRLRQRAVFLLD